MLNEVITFIGAHWVATVGAVIVAWLLKNKFSKGLNQYPGPWLAGLTDCWRFYKVRSWDFQETNIQLHREHGDVVRLGPNDLSFADPRAIKVIYGLNKGYVKSSFYPVQTAVAKGRPLPSMFSTTDEAYHSRYRRCVNNAFTMSSLQSYEPLVNSTVEHFMNQTQKMYAASGKICDFGTWLQYFAFDVVGEITWSKRLGFTDRNEDIQGIVSSTKNFIEYAAGVGQLPLLDRLFNQNPVKLAFERWGWIKRVFPVTAFALAREAERAPTVEKTLESREAFPQSRPGDGVDLLSKFKQAQQDHPEFMTDTQVLASSCSMIFAGSDTTAISLSAVFYYVVSNPHVYTKLMAELDEAVRDGRIEDREAKTVTWPESQQLPYLDAVIQEALRLHPAIGLPLERIVPAGGADILGHHIPGGTIVGCNPWVIHRRPEVFGDAVDDFRPERWLEASEEQLKNMKASMFQFGAGSRTCLGKNIALLEMYKLVPTFLRRFEIELAHPEQPWRMKNAWFVKQYGFETTFRPRQVQ